MVKPENLLKIRLAAKKMVLFLPHAVQQMQLPDRDLRKADVLNAIDHGQIIEDYPADSRGSSSLILGPDCFAEPIHVVCAVREDYLAILTAYRPSEDEWTKDFRKRKKS
jgi:hypothetical protein